MALQDDLLALSREVLDLAPGPGRPRQALLRRAVSTAYYALFHLLIDEATRRIGLSGDGVKAHRRAIARSFKHAEMKRASRAFSSGNLHEALGNVVIPADLQAVATAFVELQEDRHQADYDVNRQFRKTEAVIRVEQAEEAFKAWDRVRDQSEARLYLALLNTYNGLKA